MWKIPRIMLLIFMVLPISACQTSNFEYTPNAAGDWPVYDIEELLDKSDLVVYVKVMETENSKNGSLPIQLSTLSVIESIKGEPDTDTIILDLSDPDYFVKSGSNYLMFLSNIGEHFTQIDPNSIIKEENGKFKSSIIGLNGEYSLTEIQSKISNLINEP